MNEPRNITVGTVCEIKPAYSSETGTRSIWDEIAGCECVVLRICDNDDVLVQIKNGDEDYVYWQRLRPLR